MRVLMFSTHEEPCGIAAYNSSLAAAFSDCGSTARTIRIPRSEPDEITAACRAFRNALPGAEIGIVQHHWAFFGNEFRASAERFASLLRSLDGATPVVVFMHSGFPMLPPSRT